jgi:hypothetical protein
LLESRIMDNLQELGIYDWNDLKDTFDGSDILIGNGFSINLHQELSYKSLFEIFKTQCRNPKVINLFKALKTHNFEFVMDVLNNARDVGEIFNLDYEKIIPIIGELRIGLINAICQTHPSHKDLYPEIFRSLAVDFLSFRDIYTTNYDIFLYKIILSNNNLIKLCKIRGQEFQDEFYDKLGKHKLGIGDEFANCRKIYYLHGALFLYHDFQGTYKIAKGDHDGEYINMLRIEIENGNSPLFIAEGNSQDKLNAINRNYYLRSCSQALKVSNKDLLVIYGSSFNNNDSHITGWINQSKPKSIAISIYTTNKDENTLKEEMSRLNNLFVNSQIAFYDSSTLFSFYPQHKF